MNYRVKACSPQDLTSLLFREGVLRAEELPLREGGLSLTEVGPEPGVGPCAIAVSFSRVPFSRGSTCSPFACGEVASCQIILVNFQLQISTTTSLQISLRNLTFKKESLIFFNFQNCSTKFV